MDTTSDMRLLIVDDNAANVALLEQVLAQGGYDDILSTRDATAASTMCHAHRPDLLLLDLHMPVLSGLRRARRDP